MPPCEITIRLLRPLSSPLEKLRRSFKRWTSQSPPPCPVSLAFALPCHTFASPFAAVAVRHLILRRDPATCVARAPSTMKDA